MINCYICLCINSDTGNSLRNMHTLLLLRGIPGSGKTTLAHEIAEGKWPVFSADNFFESIVEGEIAYNFDATKLGEAHSECLAKTEMEMIRGTAKIIVANTFTTDREMLAYFEAAERRNYRVFSLVVENRHGNKNVHAVPDETLEKMRNRFTVKL